MKKKRVLYFILVLLIVFASLMTITSCKSNEKGPSDSAVTDPEKQPEEKPDSPGNPSLPVDPENPVLPEKPTESDSEDPNADEQEKEKPSTEKPLPDASIVRYATSVKHGYSIEYLGEIERKIPLETKDEGLSTKYPKYGSTLSLTDEEKSAILSENNLLNGKNTSNTGGTYDKIDKDGNLYVWDSSSQSMIPLTYENGSKRMLYKHTASVGMYGGNVSDNEKAVIKRITFQPRGYSSYSITGLYAPAGEIVKIEMSEEDFLATGGVTVHIGQALYNGQSNNIWAAKNFNRMPVILNTLLFNSSTAEYDQDTHTYTCYVGSFLGGPIYIRNTSKPVTLTISGAVNYRHFIYGLTTEEEFKKLSESSAPYFDLEVWDLGVLHSGPSYAAKGYSYSDLYDVAVLWDKVSAISTQVKKQGIVFLYDSFVAAGAAVAFPGRSSVNCPIGWMTNALDYNGIITSGSWGNFHEYNHNFQGWGLPDGGEVTNNALNLVAYAQLTNISALRTMTVSGEAGLSGWNSYTTSSWSLNSLKSGSYNQLSVYSTLLHNIGSENFIKSANASGVTNYFNKLCSVTGYDMTYFFKEIINYIPDDLALSNISDKNLPKFIPIGCVYQIGRDIITVEGKKADIKTMRPFHIVYGESYDLDLSPYVVNANGQYQGGSIVLPSGFSYSIKNITTPKNGSLIRKEGNIYTYIPDNKEIRSGEIRVTLQITKDDDSTFKVDDIDIIIELEQTHELKKSVLERTIYKFTPEVYAGYATAVDAYEANFDGYSEKITEDNINPVQNGNAEIWGPNPSQNAFMVISGKIYIAETGDYRIALRGRHSVALYISTDEGVTYTCGAYLNNSNTNTWWATENGYCDLKDLKAGNWIYFKGILRSDYASAFIGVGWGKFEISGTINENGEFVDENNNVIDESAAKRVTLSYANAFRTNYQFPTSAFKSEYLFYKNTVYNFDNSYNYGLNGTLVNSNGYTPWSESEYPLTNLFDDDDTNCIHSSKGVASDITSENPFEITVDLGETITATTMTIYGHSKFAYLPTDFVLYVGTTPDDLYEIMSVTSATVTNNNVVVTFPEQTFRYYKFVCTATQVSGSPAGYKYIAFRCIKFSYPLQHPNGKQIALDNSDIKLLGTWNTVYKNSSFGRLNVAEKGSVIEFTFNGTMFSVLSDFSENPNDITIYIDGEVATSAFAGLNPQNKGIAFLSEKLSSDNHIVKIICNSKTSFDSIVIW